MPGPPPGEPPPPTPGPDAAGVPGLDVAALTEPGKEIRLERKRPSPLGLSNTDKMMIVERVRKFARDDEDDRIVDKRYREQRYAKLMQWAEPARGPWEDATNVTLPDMLTAVLRTEDTLLNAALATRPMINSRALDPKNQDKQRRVDLLQDNQFFVENGGEKLLERMAMNFDRDGTVTNYVRWVTEFKKIQQLRVFDPIPLGQVPEQYFRRILTTRFRTDQISKIDEDGWDWDVTDLNGTELSIRFYTDSDHNVEMEVRAEVQAFDGPLIQTMPYESVLHPYWCENLQAPGPSNPNGAEHVILVDRPTIDEVGRLIDQKVYDLIDRKDVEGRTSNNYLTDRPENDLQRQRDDLRGFTESRPNPSEDTRNLGRTLRFTCFDLWARDGEGASREVVWTVLPELDLLARARPLSEMMPGNPPKRPFAEASFIPVQDRRIGISLPEVMEGLHDFQTTVFNQMGDACAIEIQPFGTYKPNSNINPEEYQIYPGALLPRQNADDLNFERIQPTATSVGINQITIAQGMEEKLTSIGDLQLGRIPTGKSAALRTSSGVNQLLAQGEARPERILRRFFSCLRDTYQLMWQLNREFLDDKKRFRVMGVAAPNEDPFIQMTTADLTGDYQFDFQANVLNTSKVALQESLGQILTLMVNPLMLQLGIAQPEGIYRLMLDHLRSLGQTGEKYLSEPVPGARAPKVSAPEALSSILGGEMPVGLPAEPQAQEHLQTLGELLMRTDDQGIMLQQTLEPFHKKLLQAWMAGIQRQILEEQQKAQMMANAQQLQGQLQQESGGGGPQPGGGKPANLGSGMVGPHDVMDESMPASGTPQG